MRNVFDQYRHLENRLTHALATSLYESRPLLESFSQLVGHPLPSRAVVTVTEQFRPGEREVSEEEAEKKGLPDAWMDDGFNWALIIESKIQHRISFEQLVAHRRAARGYSDAQVVLISVKEAPAKVRGEFKCITWTQVYEWAVAQARAKDAWALRLARYMEVAERKMIDEERELNGTLTTFTGIPFDATNPYSYVEAKRLLRLLMEQVRSRQDLGRALGVDLSREGRAAITGKAGFAVWDMLPLGTTGAHFTDAPHLTLGIRHDEAVAQLTIPNNVSRPIRRQLVGGSVDEFKEMLAQFTRDIKPVMKKDPNCKPYVEVIQRHWPHRRALAVKDAELVFDPRTVEGDKLVKEQPEWLEVAFNAVQNKQSNLQIAVGVRFPYGTSTVVSTAGFAEVVVQVFLSTGAILARAGYAAN